MARKGKDNKVRRSHENLERITVSFNMKLDTDRLLYEVLTRNFTKMYRGAKLKEFALEYLKEHRRDLIDSVLEQQNKEEAKKKNIPISDNFDLL